MALKAILDSIDDLPEDVKKEYVERNGRYELQVEISGDIGVKSYTDFNNLNRALKKERDDHKAVRERISLLGDRDINDVVAQLDRIPELEAAAAGKIDDEKINQIVETRVRTKIAPVERERDTLRNQLGEHQKTLEEMSKKERTRMVHDAVRQAAAQVKVLPEALEDALLLAERVFEISEDGKVITKDGVGATPGVEASVWFTDMQAKRPHWWGPSAGSGAMGNRGSGNGGPNPWSADGWNMTEQGRIYRENPTRAEQLAKAAGTTIGGQRPKPKK